MTVARVRARLANPASKTRDTDNILSPKMNLRDFILGAATLACEPMQDEIRLQATEAICVFAVLLSVRAQDERRREVHEINLENAGHLRLQRQADISPDARSP